MIKTTDCEQVELEGCEPNNLVQEWQNSSMPHQSTLAWVVGKYDYYRKNDVSWEEKVSLAGEACGYTSDAVWDIKNRPEGCPDAQDAVTEESVEDFFVEWRTRFLERVLKEAKFMNPKREA